VEDGVPVVRGEHLLKDGTISTDWDDYWCVSQTDAGRFPKTLLQAGDIVMAVRGTVGTLSRAGPQHVGCQISPNTIRISADQRKVEPAFLFFALGHLAPSLVRTSTNQSALPSLNARDIKRIAVSFPPLAEQKKIAEILGSVDEAIQATQAVIDQTRKVKQGLLQQLLTRGIGHTRFKQTEIGEIPEEWEVSKTGAECESIVPGRNRPKSFDGDIPWINISDIYGPTVSSSKSGLAVSREALSNAKGRTIPADTVIMTCVGTFGVSTVALREMIINQQLHGFVCGPRLLPRFLRLVLETKEEEMKSLAGQTTIPYLNRAKCESIRFALPPLDEQHEIAQILGSTEDTLSENFGQNKALKGVKRGLMQDLLTGRVRVTSDCREDGVA
jgi:type I restriction enzyme S subunit